MKRIFLAFTMLLLVGAAAAKAEPGPKPGGKQIFYVSASAEVQAKPDRVHLTFGVAERSKDLRAAKERMSGTLRKAIAFCKANGIQDKHIQTSYLSIYPDYRYDDDKGKNLLRHYALTQAFTITLENPDIYETILYTLLDMGINSVRHISFTTSELRKYRDEARLAAVRAAQEKAQLLAGAAGLKLGKAINIQEGQPVRNQPTLRRAQGAYPSQNVLEASAVGDVGEGFALGTIPVSAEVTITYELE